tara:strand:- start:648 stop:902 length:255 start_codon:yes stop_codon:yes gene_type:complete
MLIMSASFLPTQTMIESSTVKYFIIGVFLIIVGFLAKAFHSLMFRKNQNDNAMVNALTIRVVLSVALLATIFILNALGFVSFNT